MSCDETILTVKTVEVPTIRMPSGAALELAVVITGLDLTALGARFEMTNLRETGRSYQANSWDDDPEVTVEENTNTVRVAIAPGETFALLQNGVCKYWIEVCATETGATLMQVTGKINWLDY